MAAAKAMTSMDGPIQMLSPREGGSSAGTVRLPRKRGRRAWLTWLLRLGILVLIVLAWQLSSTQGLVSPVYAGTPSKVWPEFLHGVEGSFWGPTGTTVYEALMGFVLGSAAGILVGCLLIQSARALSVAEPFIVGLNAMPRIALAPLFVIWFGLGSTSRIALGFSLVFFVALVNTLAGVKSADRDHLLLARVLGAKRVRTFKVFILPAAMPAIFAGLQLGLVYSFLAAIVGEMLTGNMGLGGQMAYATNTFEMDRFFAQLFFLVLVTVAMSRLFSLFESKLLAWKAL